MGTPSMPGGDGAPVTPTPGTGSPDPSAAPERTLTGTVVSGVEAGCRLLEGYLLLGGDRTQYPPGSQVRVTGTVREDLVTTCQQGIPLLVTSVVPAG